MNTQKKSGGTSKTLIVSAGALILFLLLGRQSVGVAGQANPISFDTSIQALTFAYTSTADKLSQAIQKPNNLRVLGIGFFAIHSLVFERWTIGRAEPANPPAALSTPTEAAKLRDTSQETAIPEESTEMKTFYETSERFLGNTGGISPAKESEPLKEVPVKGAEPKVEPKKEPPPVRVIKAEKTEKDVYEKEKCDEIPYGWSCSSFYPGGVAKTTVNKQHYQEGDSEKGSSWMSEHRMEWDKNGSILKNEVLKTQSEWQHDELKDYFYAQTYKNGVLIHEKYDDKLANPTHKAQGLIVETGRI